MRLPLIHLLKMPRKIPVQGSYQHWIMFSNLDPIYDLEQLQAHLFRVSIIVTLYHMQSVTEEQIEQIWWTNLSIE